MKMFRAPAFLLTVLAAAPVLAQTCQDTQKLEPKTAQEAGDLWSGNRDDDCLGEDKCNSALCVSVGPSIEKIKGGKMAPTAALRAVFQDLEAAGKGPLYEKLRRRMGLYLAQVSEGGTFENLNGSQFEISAAQRLFESQPADTIDFELYLQEQCSTPASCTAAWREAAAVATQSTLFRRIIVASMGTGRLGMVEYLTGLDARWRHYVLGPRAQYPWELLVNGWRYRKAANLVEPPNNQFIFAHPSTALELSGRDKGQAAASLLLEAFGWNSWTWQGNETRQRFGASAILSWRTTTALAGDRIFGYGAMVHLPHSLSIGYVYRPTDLGRHSLVLGADAAKLFTKGSDARKELLGGQ